MTDSIVRSDSDIWTKFKLAENLILESRYWTVLLRPKQVTVGSCVLISNRLVESIGELAPEEAADLPVVISRLESLLRNKLQMEKINYLSLMMVDSHLHFHVIPRYSTPRVVGDVEYVDKAWPKPPIMSDTIDSNVVLDDLREVLLSDV